MRKSLTLKFYKLVTGFICFHFNIIGAPNTSSINVKKKHTKQTATCLSPLVSATSNGERVREHMSSLFLNMAHIMGVIQAKVANDMKPALSTGWDLHIRNGILTSICIGFTNNQSPAYVSLAKFCSTKLQRIVLGFHVEEANDCKLEA